MEKAASLCGHRVMVARMMTTVTAMAIQTVSTQYLLVLPLQTGRSHGIQNLAPPR